MQKNATAFGSRINGHESGYYSCNTDYNYADCHYTDSHYTDSHYTDSH